MSDASDKIADKIASGADSVVRSSKSDLEFALPMIERPVFFMAWPALVRIEPVLSRKMLERAFDELSKMTFDDIFKLVNQHRVSRGAAPGAMPEHR